MEPLSAALLVLLLVLGGGALIAGGAWLLRRPVQTFETSWHGHDIRVENLVTTERVYVDGERVKGSRTGGDGLTWAEHAVTLPSGEALTIRLSVEGMVAACTIRSGDRVVFESSRTADVAAPPAPAVEDPRWEPATVLLAPLRDSEEPEVARAAGLLHHQLRQAMLALADARSAAAAHAALGGEADEQVVAACDRVVDELLAAVRELHRLAVRTSGATDMAAVHDVLDRIAARREVEGRLPRESPEATAGRLPDQNEETS